MAPGESEARTNFSVRAPGRLGSRAPGSLYIAGGKVLETRRWDTIVQALVGHLAGIVGDPGEDAGVSSASDARLALVQGRVVAHDGRAVIVTASCSGPLDVAEIAALGGAELHVWQPVIDPVSRAVVVPEPLGGLDWRAGRVEPTPVTVGPLEVVGVVTGPSAEGRPDLVSAWMAGRRALDEWGVLLSFLDGEGRIRAALTAEEVVARTAELLRAT